MLLTPIEQAVKALRERAEKNRHWLTTSGIDAETKRACEISAATFDEAADLVEGIAKGKPLN